MRALLGQADLVEEDDGDHARGLHLVPPRRVEGLLDPGGGRQGRALVAEHLHRREGAEELAVRGLAVHVRLDDPHREGLGGARLPDDEDRDAVEHGDHDHEEVLEERLVQRDPLPQPQVRDEPPHHVPDDGREPPEVELQPGAPGAVPRHALGCAAEEGSVEGPDLFVPDRLLQPLPRALERGPVLAPGGAVEPGVEAVGQRHDHRLAHVRARDRLHVEEVRRLPLLLPLATLAGLLADVVREVLAEPAEDLDAAGHVAKAHDAPLALVVPPDELLGGADKLGEDLDEVDEAAVLVLALLLELLHHFLHLLLGHGGCVSAAAAAAASAAGAEQPALLLLLPLFDPLPLRDELRERVSSGVAGASAGEA
mmetsp:Transcript_8640/g.21261  ORF Transcript_8640/g.21261 Transcript_8640/m.21261 type:complete len:368 (-) Transcript_8640:1515-2618(-)